MVMRKILDRAYDGSLFLAGVFLVLIFVVMISESVGTAISAVPAGISCGCCVFIVIQIKANAA